VNAPTRIFEASMSNIERQHRTRVLERAFEVLESEERALAWLNQTSPALGDVTPASLLATEGGTERVLYELGQIEYGHPV